MNKLIILSPAWKAPLWIKQLIMVWVLGGRHLSWTPSRNRKLGNQGHTITMASFKWQVNGIFHKSWKQNSSPKSAPQGCTHLSSSKALHSHTYSFNRHLLGDYCIEHRGKQVLLFLEVPNIPYLAACHSTHFCYTLSPTVKVPMIPTC